MKARKKQNTLSSDFCLGCGALLALNSSVCRSCGFDNSFEHYEDIVTDEITTDDLDEPFALEDDPGY